MGFEPTASASRTQRSTKLSHSPLTGQTDTRLTMPGGKSNAGLLKDVVLCFLEAEPPGGFEDRLPESTAPRGNGWKRSGFARYRVFVVRESDGRRVRQRGTPPGRFLSEQPIAPSKFSSAANYTWKFSHLRGFLDFSQYYCGLSQEREYRHI